jgi:hypothetical protein
MTLKFLIVGLRVNEDRVVGVELKMSPQWELKNIVDIYIYIYIYSSKIMTRGVPQGSSLSLFYFFLYIRKSNRERELR